MRPLLGPLVVGLAGVLTLAMLFPKYDPSGRLGAVLNRERAIAKTRQFATENGVDANTWSARAIDLLEMPTGPLKIRVELTSPAGRTMDVEWSPDGEMASSRLPDAPRRKSPPKVTVKNQSNGGVRVSLSNDLAAQAKVTYLAVRIVEGIWGIVIFIYFVVAAIRRRLRYRVALILAAALVLPLVARFWGGTGYEQTRMLDNVDLGDQSHFASIIWIFVCGAVGYSLRIAGNRQKWASVELAVGGGLFSRQVGTSVASGILCGIGIAAVPYLVAASGVIRGAAMLFRETGLLAAPVPAFAAWQMQAAATAVSLFGLMFPLLMRIKRRPVRWVLIATAGIAVVGVRFEAFSTPGANLLTSAALFAAFLVVYLRIDLLASMAAMVAAQSALGPYLLFSQANGSVRAMAVPLLLIWFAALAASINFAIRGREGIEPPAAPSLEPADDRDTKTGRIRLEAEFEVARKAQDGALPAAPPSIEGYTLAGSCQPAKQVGGDLYDYFPLSDGRLGVAVADVSGKGVPAALYMMVTKGLLAATTRESSDLRYILQQINQHLHRACRKKVFVTMGAVVLDPVKRRLQHGRAGHNPILWRRTARAESVFLKPPGLALGMTPGERFNRMLQIEELELEPGDAIVLYSDGITEAVDSKMDQYGEPRLVRAVEQTDGRPAEDSRAAILRDLAEFTGTTPARDDVTLVVLRVAGNGVLI